MEITSGSGAETRNPRLRIEPFRLERYFAEHEFSARYLLCSSDCESMSVAELLAMEPGAVEKLSSLRLGYSESQGNPELRAAIATLYAATSADEVLVHSGAEEAIFNFMNVALEPGDHIAVQAPCYQSLAEVARSIGAEVWEWKADASSGWALNLEELRGALTERTKVVVVNFPHNPTGFLPAPDFLRELSGLSDERGFLVFCDEVYRGLELDARDRLPAFSDVNQRGVSLGVMSKTYGLAGLRIGWLATRNAELYAKLAAFKDYTTICNSAPSEFLATTALKNAETIAERNLGIIRENLALLNEFFARHQDLFKWHSPKAGSIAFPELLKGTTNEFCEDLLAKTGVLLLPGTLYGPDYNSFRVGFGRRNLPEALEKFDRYVEDLE